MSEGARGQHGAASSVSTFYQQLLSMAAQQGARQKRRKVHKGLSQQGGHFLQGSLQLCGNTVKEIKTKFTLELE